MAVDDEKRESVVSQIGQGVKSNLITAAATGIVAALLSAWALVLKVPGKIGLTPTGAVMAFDLKDGCPSGWSPYDKGAGIFIIGAATKNEIDKIPGSFTEDEAHEKISERPFDSHGGEQKHTLTIGQMPNHQHKQDSATRPSQGLYGEYPAGPSLLQAMTRNNVEPGVLVSSAGGSEPHNTIPPYVALWWCRKG